MISGRRITATISYNTRAGTAWRSFSIEIDSFDDLPCRQCHDASWFATESGICDAEQNKVKKTIDCTRTRLQPECEMPHNVKDKRACVVTHRTWYEPEVLQRRRLVVKGTTHSTTEWLITRGISQEFKNDYYYEVKTIRRKQIISSEEKNSITINESYNRMSIMQVVRVQENTDFGHLYLYLESYESEPILEPWEHKYL